MQWAEPYLKDKLKLHRVMDRQLKRNFPAQEAHEFAEIILKCLHLDPKSRPTMTEVVARLEKIQSASNHNQPDSGISTHQPKCEVVAGTWHRRALSWIILQLLFDFKNFSFFFLFFFFFHFFSPPCGHQRGLAMAGDEKREKKKGKI